MNLPITALRILIISLIFSIIPILACDAADETISTDQLIPKGVVLFTLGDYLPSNRNDLYLIDTDGSNLRQLTENHHLDDFADCRADTGQAVFVSSPNRKTDWDIWLIDIGLESATPLYQRKGRDETPVWISGNRIGWTTAFDPPWLAWFGATHQESREIITGPIPAGKTVRITRNRLWEETPTWKENPNEIFFTSPQEEDPGDIFRMEYTGLNIQPFIELSGWQRSAKWSPDGRWVVFESNSDQGFERSADVYIADSIGGSVRNLTQSIGLNGGPDWAGNNQWIVFHSNRSGSWDLYLMKRDGSNVRRITNSSLNAFRPTWCGRL